MTTTDLDLAYRYCEDVVRREARNFSYGIRLLPPVKRRALSAVYAVARRIDDIGDGDLPTADKQILLEQAGAELRKVEAQAGRAPVAVPGDPVLTALADAARRRPVPLGAFQELVAGCLADVRATRYDDFDALVWYCRCVAGSIGRLSLGVFGSADPDRASRLADSLGVALQLTNILRDVREDRLNGRVYLPAEDLRRFGCRLEPGRYGFTDPPDRLAALIRFEAERAERWYRQGLRLLALLDGRSAACTAAMAGIYHRLLDRIHDDPLGVTRARLSLPGREKAYVAARALVRRSA
ncbi:MAG TPA: squalene/phytoene synthase family protein [Micromonosporaceae bacterium]